MQEEKSMRSRESGILTEEFMEASKRIFVDMGTVSLNWFSYANLSSSNLFVLSELHIKLLKNLHWGG